MRQRPEEMYIYPWKSFPGGRENPRLPPLFPFQQLSPLSAEMVCKIFASYSITVYRCIRACVCVYIHTYMYI